MNSPDFTSELNPLCDAHNHLQDERLAPRLRNLLKELPLANVGACVVNGTREQDWPAVKKLSRRDWVVSAYGLHPWYAKERSPSWFDALRRYLDDDSGESATIGEIGLDRWIENHDIADQEKVFVAQLELAAERNVAASIHCL